MGEGGRELLSSLGNVVQYRFQTPRVWLAAVVYEYVPNQQFVFIIPLNYEKKTIDFDAQLELLGASRCSSRSPHGVDIRIRKALLQRLVGL